MNTDEKLAEAQTETRNPSAFLKLVAGLSIEGECILHGHPTQNCLTDPNCCDVNEDGAIDPCPVQEYSEDQDEAAALFNLIGMARKLIEPCDPDGDRRYREAARFVYAVEGAIEIDNDAMISGAHNHAPDEPCNNADPEGAYVAAWLWVDADDPGL